MNIDFISAATVLEMDRDMDGGISEDEFVSNCRVFCQMLTARILNIFGI